MTIDQRQKLDRKYREVIQKIDSRETTFDRAFAGMDEIVNPRSIADLNIYSEQYNEDEDEGRQ